MTYTIYVAVNEINGKAYVGQTKHGLRRRRKSHEYAAGSETAAGVFSKALRKYGFDSFTWWVLETVDGLDAANEREVYYISQIGSLVPSGYNLDSGGKNRVVHEDSRRKMSEAAKGRVISIEARRKMSESGKKRKATDEVRQRMSEAQRGHEVKKETRLKISAAHQENKCLTVLQNKMTREIRVFESRWEAARSLGLEATNISKLVYGKLKSTGGWVLLEA